MTPRDPQTKSGVLGRGSLKGRDGHGEIIWQSVVNATAKALLIVLSVRAEEEFLRYLAAVISVDIVKGLAKLNATRATAEAIIEVC